MKILFLDGDGVALRSRGYFSNKIAQEYNIPVEHIIPFFKNEYRKCQLGQADTKEELIHYLSQWNCDKSVEDFLEYWFTSATEENVELIELVQEIRRTGVQCYLASDQEKYRAKYLRERLGFNNKFDGCLFSCDLGASKDDPIFFKKSLVQLKADASDVIYFDDETEDIQVAKSIGIDARLYSSVDDLKNI